MKVFPVGCDACFLVLLVRGDERDIDRLIVQHEKWSEGIPCPRCTANLRVLNFRDTSILKDAAEQNLVTKIELTPQQFFRAACGLGFPDEVTCDVDVVRSLLLANRVVDVVARSSASHRALLDEIHLDNGLVIHLTASSKGACVFKIARKHNVGDHNAEVLQDSKDGDLRGDVVAVQGDDGSSQGS